MDWKIVAGSLLYWFRGFEERTPNRRRLRRCKLGVEQLETRAVPSVFNAADFGSIQEAIDAAALNPGDDKVVIDPGAYVANLSINDSSGALTLQGVGEIPSDVVLHGNGATVIDALLHNDVTIRNLRITNGIDGIRAQAPSSSAESSDLTVRRVEAVNNSQHGLVIIGKGAEASGVGDVHIQATTLSGNGGDGIFVMNVGGTVTLKQVVAADNGERGANIRKVGAVSDAHGSYTANDSHGVVLFDIAGDVTLRGTNSSDNNFDRADNTGAGVRMADGTDSDVVAVGGNVTVTNGVFNNNRTGFYSSGRILGDVSLTNISANENELEGIRFQDQQAGARAIVGDLRITNATANRNEKHGVWIENAVAGNVHLLNLSATDNGFSARIIPGSGLLIAGAGEVVIRGGDFSRNEDDGIHVENAALVKLINVVAEGNGDFDLETINSGDPVIVAGSITKISVFP